MTSPSASQVTTAVRTLDCARKVRIHYFLTVPLSNSFLAAFAGFEIKIDRFSEHVATAKDHVTIKKGARLHGSGVLGEKRLVVTFRKEETDYGCTIAEFERRLAQAGAGPVRPAGSGERPPGEEPAGRSRAE